VNHPVFIHCLSQTIDTLEAHPLFSAELQVWNGNQKLHADGTQQHEKTQGHISGDLQPISRPVKEKG